MEVLQESDIISTDLLIKKTGNNVHFSDLARLYFKDNNFDTIVSYINNHKIISKQSKIKYIIFHYIKHCINVDLKNNHERDFEKLYLTPEIREEMYDNGKCAKKLEHRIHHQLSIDGIDFDINEFLKENEVFQFPNILNYLFYIKDNPDLFTPFELYKVARFMQGGNNSFYFRGVFDVYSSGIESIGFCDCSVLGVPCTKNCKTMVQLINNLFRGLDLLNE